MKPNDVETRIRAAGIYINEAHILLESLADREVWGIPGGSVEPRQALEQACMREYAEETDIAVTCNRLAIVHEQFWTEYGQVVREHCF